VGNGGSIASNAFEANNSLKNLILGADIVVARDTFSISAYYDYMSNSRKAGTYDNTVRYTEKTEGDYQFVQTKYGAVITRYNGFDGSRLDIPAQLGGAAVTGIDGYNDQSVSPRRWKGAFQEKGISRMRLPEGLAFIEAWAFYRNQLTSITFPDSVIFIGERAFQNNQLTSVTIGNGVNIRPFVFDDIPAGGRVILIRGTDIPGLGFHIVYRDKLAGKYTRPDAKSSDWTKQ